MGAGDTLFQIGMTAIPSKKKKQHEALRSSIISSDFI